MKSKIYYIRKQKVMLDFELAEIHGYFTKRLNEQVKRNHEKSDEYFMFQLTDEEAFELSRSQNAILNKDMLTKKHHEARNLHFSDFRIVEAALFLGSFLLLRKWKVNPVLIIFGTGILGTALYVLYFFFFPV